MSEPTETDEEKLQKYQRSVKKSNRKFAWLFVAVVIMGIIWIYLYFS